MYNIQTLPIAVIRENPVALRAVNRESEQYQGLVASVREKGFMGAITVCPAKPSGNETEADVRGKFEILDGLHRFTAAKDAGLEEIPCQIEDMSKDQALEWQLMANLHKVDTKPIEFTQQLQRMLANNPTMVISELAAKIGVSTAWIHARLNLLKLHDKVQPLVDDNKIPLSNAFALAKLPVEEQEAFVERAMTQSTAEFTPQVNSRKKELNEARKEGRKAKDEEFTPAATLQKKGDIEIERENKYPVLKALVNESGAKSAMDGVRIAIDWILHLDPKSVAEQKAKWEERKQKAAEAAEKRKAEREANKAKEAADVKAEMEADREAAVA